MKKAMISAKQKTHNFDEMMQRAWPDHVKVKAKFPRNSASHFEDYLICVTTLEDGHDNCINDSRSPGVDKERVHLKIPQFHNPPPENPEEPEPGDVSELIEDDDEFDVVDEIDDDQLVNIA